MNNMYITPCNPLKCNDYVYGERCGKEETCQPYLNYEALKIHMKAEKFKETEIRDYHIKSVQHACDSVKGCKRGKNY